MRIHALSSGTVRLKDSFLHPRRGMRRQLGLFMPGAFSDPMPIHLWVVEHEATRILVDTGEVSAVKDIPFAKFEVKTGDELPALLATLDLEPGDIDTVVLTHMHGDHMDGAVHLRGAPVLVNTKELAYSKTAMPRLMARVLRQPIPEDVAFAPMDLAGGPFGAFEASMPLTEDRRVVAVATPGHTPGHVSVVCVDDEGRHVLLAGDATDSLEQLRSRRPDAIGPTPAVTVATIDRILAHAAEHPLVYLPSHDPESTARLDGRVCL